MKRIVSGLLAALLILSCAAALLACDPKKDPVETKTPDSSSPSTTPGTSEPETTETPTTVNPHADPGLPEMKYNGETFTMLGWSEYSGVYGQQRDLVYLEDVKTNSINEAVRDRNDYVSDTYDVNFKGVFEDSVLERISAAEKATMTLANMFVGSLYAFGSLVNNGFVKDIRSEMGSYLDLTKPYWNQKEQQAMSILNHLYMVAGDIITVDKEGIWMVTYNRDLITDRNMTDPYELIDDGTWTVDNMYTMARTVSDYSDHEPNDWFGITWGMISESYNSYQIWMGSGVRLVKKDALTDMPYFGEMDEFMYDSILAISQFQFDTTVTLFASRITGVADTTWDGAIKIFRTGHALFKIGSVSMCEWLREYDMDFGVLPMPKYSVEQREYCSSLNENYTCLVGFQKSLGLLPNGEYDAAVIDFSAIITEALCCESTDTLLSAYYDNTLVYKALRQEKDERMLKLVFDSRTFDLSLSFDWCSAFIQNISGAKSESRINRVKSSYDSYAASVKRAIDSFLSAHGMA
ncbi:MAG: hypothetical protein II797_05845 [Clostridia bacterium]|nr:hypothetical protein [Clostridia bacterium]